MSVMEGFSGGRGGRTRPERRPGSSPEDCSCTASWEADCPSLSEASREAGCIPPWEGQ